MNSEADKKAAISWWNSLPGGKKRYYKEHSRLGTPERITRYWLANIKPMDTRISESEYRALDRVLFYLSKEQQSE